MFSRAHITHHAKTILIGLVIGFSFGLLVLGIGAATTHAYRSYYDGRIFYGVRSLGLDLGGLTPVEAERAIREEFQKIWKQGIRFSTDEKELSSIALSSVANYDTHAMAEQAYSIGRSYRYWVNTMILLDLRFRNRTVLPRVAIDEPTLTGKILDILQPVTQPVKNANLQISVRGTKPTYSIEPERVGFMADRQTVLRDVVTSIQRVSNAPIAVRIARTEPEITKDELALLAEQQIPLFFSHTPFTLQAYDRNFVLTPMIMAEWLVVSTSTGSVSLELSDARIKQTIDKWLVDFLTIAKDGSLTMENNTIKSFEPAIDGEEVDIDATRNALEEAWQRQEKKAQIQVVRKEARILGADAEQLGIVQSIGVGRSNFSGSPSNRRKNIALGAKKVNFSLIAPDQEFSLLKTLGEIDGEHGWLPELVIKGDKTTPEFGGGLCQIGTTTFRAALASGLPITQRQNHSYRVRYYEPAGTDATIYVPAPDFRFINDTDHWLIITTSIRRDELAFTVWGTKDGRVVEQTKPKISNIVPAPPKKIIESLEIPVGETKCTEVAHAGADASFDYSVTYPDGNVKKTTFKSHYKPWGAVCLIGVASLTTPDITPIALPIDETVINPR